MPGATRLCAALATTALGVAFLAGPAPGAATAAVLPTHVVAVSSTPGVLAVDGVRGTADARIDVVATDDRGAIGDCDAMPQDLPGEGRLVEVDLQRSPGVAQRDKATVWLHHVTTDAAGEHWTGTWHVASTRDGTWTVRGIWWCTGMHLVDIDPLELGIDTSITIHGTHLPTVVYAYVPAVVPYGGRQRMTAHYTDGYGRALAGYRIVVGRDELCLPSSGLLVGERLAVTDAHGAITVPVIHGSIQCVFLANPATNPLTIASTMLDEHFFAGWEHFRSVTRAVSSSRVRTGHLLVVTGTVSPRVGATVELQRLVGRTWRTVAVAAQRMSGHVTLRYVPTSPGRMYLRLRARTRSSSSTGLAPTASRPITVVVRRH